MNAENLNTCGYCRHGVPSAQLAGGIECRRNPPQIVLLPAPPSLAQPNQPALSINALHPVLAPSHHCGEFSRQGLQ